MTGGGKKKREGGFEVQFEVIYFHGSDNNQSSTIRFDKFFDIFSTH